MSTQRDPWFWSHYNDAASVILDLAPGTAFAAGCRVVDFGCGDGITACGVASRAGAEVIGVDLYQTYLQLPAYLAKNLAAADPPPNLRFKQNAPGQPLPLPDSFADLVYSWSVFEHLSNPDEILGDLKRILKLDGFLFLQIEPLYYSPFGSHLQRLIPEPWAHLIYPESDFLRIAESARDNVPEAEHDTLYRTHAFEDVKKYLIAEFLKLNRITADKLSQSVRSHGFDIVSERRIRIEGISPPPSLLGRYPFEDLVTNQVVVIAQRRHG